MLWLWFEKEMFLPSGPWFAMVISLIHKLPDRSIRHHGWTSDAKNEIKTHRLTQARNKVQREINKTLVALLVYNKQLQLKYFIIWVINLFLKNFPLLVIPQYKSLWWYLTISVHCPTRQFFGRKLGGSQLQCMQNLLCNLMSNFSNVILRSPRII